MKIFIAHSSSYNYQDELYEPIRTSELYKTHEIKLPLESGYEKNTKETIKNTDIVIAEVSYPSTGQGIELGWANVYDIPIICIYQKGKKYSGALNNVCKRFVSYTSDNLIEVLVQEISSAD